jgi:hypothetical protein
LGDFFFSDFQYCDHTVLKSRASWVFWVSLRRTEVQRHQGHIRDYAGQSVAVDASSWLPKSVYSIADYCDIQKRPTLWMLNASGGDQIHDAVGKLLTHANDSKQYLVMDGQRCPLRAVTNNDQGTAAAKVQEARRRQRAGQRDKMYDK